MWVCSGCHENDYDETDAKQRSVVFAKQFYDFATHDFPVQEFDQIQNDYEYKLFSHIALIEGRALIHYIKIHKALEEQKNLWPSKIKEEYTAQRSKFIQKIDNILNNPRDLRDEYHLRDELENNYYDFIVPFVSKHAGFFIQKITTQAWRNNIVSPSEAFAFWLRHPSETQSGMINVPIQKPRIELPRIDILKTKKSNAILLVSNGCCGNLGVIPYQQINDEFKLIRIKGQKDHYFSMAATNHLKSSFYQWNQNTNTLKAHQAYTRETIEYRFNEKGKILFFEFIKIHSRDIVRGF